MNPEPFTPHPTKTTIVVVDESAIGYVNPTVPAWFQVLSSNIGSRFESMRGGYLASMANSIRLARTEDFEKFRLAPDGYVSDSDFYHFER